MPDAGGSHLESLGSRAARGYGISGYIKKRRAIARRFLFCKVAHSLDLVAKHPGRHRPRPLDQRRLQRIQTSEHPRPPDRRPIQSLREIAKPCGLHPIGSAMRVDSRIHSMPPGRRTRQHSSAQRRQVAASERKVQNSITNHNDRTGHRQMAALQHIRPETRLDHRRTPQRPHFRPLYGMRVSIDAMHVATMRQQRPHIAPATTGNIEH